MIYRKAEQDILAQSKDELEVLESYAAGVNAYLALLFSSPSTLSLPLEFVALRVKNISAWR